jgi:glycosyltransferase involved in cell wall biosynthesis
VPAEDPAALAGALAELCDDAPGAEARALRARRRVDRFDLATIAARFEEIYRAIPAR